MTRSRRSFVLALVALVLPLLVAVTPAGADGDPSSDILLGNDIYVPYYPQLSGSESNRLRSVVQQAKDAHYPIKVAIIFSPPDLGTLDQMIGHPDRYARFLSQELSRPATFGQHITKGKPVRVPVLVVMDGGVGLARGGKSLSKKPIAAVKTPDLPGADGLAETAVRAIPLLAADNGRPIKGAGPLPHKTATASKSTSDSSTSWVPIAIAALVGAAIVAGIVLLLRRRSRSAEPGAR